ncbi:MAG: hypothetical protein JST73_10580 [Actinobacteria bacterium]|nr:hypothetical protein [Actinomycetota bacterium]
MAADPPREGSWPDQATDLIVSAVGTVRDKTVGPAMTAARAIVYGLFALLIGTMALVLVSIFVIRIVTVYVGGRVWIPQIGLGVIFGIGALTLWSRARKVPHR